MIKKGLSFPQLGLVDFPKPMHWSLLSFALEPIELPFNLSGVFSPSEGKYCSNPSEVFSNRYNTFSCLGYFGILQIFVNNSAKSSKKNGRTFRKIYLCI